jgi:putative oxidoreductase
MLHFLFPLKNFSTPESVLLLILRLLFGILLMWHGLTKMSNFESLVATFPNPLGLGSRFSLYMIIFVEVFCSVGVIFGAFYRLALIPMIFSMCVAFVVVHRGQPFAAKELAFIYLVVFVVLFAMGAGKYSLDNIIATLLHRENVANSIKAGDATTPHPQGSEHPAGDAPRQ